MSTAYLLFMLTLLIFGGAAVIALAWAISSGQMLENLSRGGNSIFAADEPIGEMTDMVLSSPSPPAPLPVEREVSAGRSHDHSN